MADFYTRFIRETFNDRGELVSYTYEYPENYNYGYDVADALGREYPDRLAMVWRNDRGDRVRLTFRDVARLSDRAANLFLSRGLRKGDALLTALRTHWEYWIAAVAAHKLGLLLVPVYYRLTEEDLAYRMEKAGVKAVLCCLEGETPGRIRAAADRAGVPVRLALGEADGFEDFSALLPEQPDALERVPTRPEEPILLYFTSGTTGRPKGVLHDHLFTLTNHCGARHMQDAHEGSLHFATGDTGWEVVCGTKFYAQWYHLAALLVIDYDRFPPELVLKLLEEERATGMMAQPTVYRKLTDAGMDRFDLSSIDNFAVGGEKLPPDLAKIVTAQTGRPLYEGYAQSETGLIAANSKLLGRREGSVGRILPKYHVELLREDGSFASPGEEGEIVLVADGGKRPLGLIHGYLDDPEATEALWDGGIFHTGDLAVKDGDGFLFFRGRSNGMIKTKGYRVSPVELEEILCLHPAVRECLVAGLPDRDLGQRITAYVHLEAGWEESEALRQELTDFHNSRCAGYKKLRELRFVPALRRNANGKVLRGQFRESEK